MRKVLELTRVLTERPNPVSVPDIHLRNYYGPEDMVALLELRHRTFARETLGVRAWDAADFQREFLEKSWWNPALFWLAEHDGIIGSVTLARRTLKETSRPVVHWLMVDPRWRRRGVATLLLRTLEAAVWDAGERQIWLETHTAWSKAEQFYRAMGYVNWPVT